jgi:carbamoyltransferase
MSKVVGISGFENSIPFKKAHWPGLEEREYRISQGHDSAAAILVDGELVAAAAEERFSRKKHTGDFPIGAIHYCCAAAGIEPNEIDEIAHGFDYSPYRAAFLLDPVSAEQYDQVFSREKLIAQVNRYLPGFPAEGVRAVNHHLAHAASAYYTSGWDECLVVVIDGMGEAHSATVYHAHDNRIDKLQEISAKDSIGILYSIITLHLGFDFNSDEYKIMCLAPYGTPGRYRHLLDQGV